MGFEKPRRIEIPLKPILEPLLEGRIIKDICEGEEICPVCNGFGVKIVTKVFGLKDDPDNGKPGSPMFPYKNQHIVLQACMDCFDGVVKRCKLCGNLIPRHCTKCNCEQQKNIDRAESERKEAERLAKAPIAPPEVEKECRAFFSDYHSDGYFQDWDEFFDEWWDGEKDKEFPVRPEYAWTTECDDFFIDARSICEQATEDLYEDAYSNISDKDFERLQNMLDEWCQSCGVGESWHISYKYKVRIPWEDYDKRYGDAG